MKTSGKEHRTGDLFRRSLLAILILGATSVLLVFVLLPMYLRGAAERLERADVGVRVENALRTGDRRLYGVHSYGPRVPVGDRALREMAMLDSLDRKLGVRYVPFTGDVFISKEHVEYNQAAISFAMEYNDALLGRLAEGSTDSVTASPSPPKQSDGTD